MYYGLYVILSLSILIMLGQAEMDTGFFRSSNLGKNWNPTNEFFSDESTNFVRNIPLKNEANIPPDSFKSSYKEKCGDCHNVFVPDEQVTGIPKTTDECSHSTKKNNSNNKEELQYKAYFTRFVNIFLRNTGLGEYSGEEDSKTVTVVMTLSKRDLTVLKSFGSGGDITLEALESSFLTLFGNVNKDNSSEETSGFREMFMYAIFIFSLLAASIYSSYLIIKINVTRSLIILLFFLLYMAVVSFDLLQQYEDIGEKIILRRLEFENLGVAPRECFLSKLNFFEKLNSFIFKDDKCKRFLESRKSIWYQMDVVSALSKPITLIFMKVCSLLGEGAERVIKPITDKCPWPLNGVLYFILSILQLPLIIFSFSLLISACSSGSISLRIPLFSLTSEKTKQYGNCNLPNRKNYEALEGGPSSSHIINNQGGIILLANNDRIKGNLLTEGGKKNLDSKIAQDIDYLKSLLQSEGNLDPGVLEKKLSIFSPTQNAIVSKIEGGSAKEMCEENETFMKNKDVYDKLFLSFSKSSDMEDENTEGLFVKNQQLVEEKLRRRKDKLFKKTHQKSIKWKNVVS